MTEKQPESHTFSLNTVIGFLSVLLLILVVALVTRLVYPRIQNQRTATPSRLISDVIQIEVLNGCGVPGLADRFTTKLREYGFDVVETGNFENFDMRKTVVIARNKERQNALRVARALGLKEENVLIEESRDFYLDATLVIGANYENINLK